MFLLLTVFLAGCVIVQTERVNITIAGIRFEATRYVEKPLDYDECYIDVMVYNSSKQLFGLEGASVLAVIGNVDLNASPNDLSKRDDITFSNGTTASTGRACLAVTCREQIRVFVEKNSAPLIALDVVEQEKHLPFGMFVDYERDRMVLKFSSYSFGSIGGVAGPVYTAHFKKDCPGDLRSNFFSFSYLTIPDKFETNVTTTSPIDFNNPNFILQWRYGIPNNPNAPRTCYLKIKVKGASTLASITAHSRTDGGIYLGSFQAGLQYDPQGKDTVNKAACVQYRCPISDIMNPANEIGTSISGSINIPGNSKGCCVKYSPKGPPIFDVNSTSFRTISPLQFGKNFGPNDGIFIHNDVATARFLCFTGYDQVAPQDYAMDVTTNYAFEYDCTLAADCVPLAVG